MKPWKGLFIVVVLLLLANISSAHFPGESTTSSPGNKQGKSTTERVTKASHQNAKTGPKPTISAVNPRTAPSQLLNKAALAKKFMSLNIAVRCKKQKDCLRFKDGPSAKCSNSSSKLCWCKESELKLYVRVNGRGHCIDLSDPCKLKRLRIKKQYKELACPKYATCQNMKKQPTYICTCEGDLDKDGVSCKRRQKPETTLTTTSEPITAEEEETPTIIETDLSGKFLNKFRDKAMKIYHLLKRYIYFVILGGSFIVVVLIILICLCRRRRRQKREMKLEMGYCQETMSHYEVPIDEMLGPLPPVPPPPPPPPGSNAPQSSSSPMYENLAAATGAPPPPPPPPPPPGTPRPATKPNKGKGNKGKETDPKAKKGGRKASANRKAIQDALGGKQKSFAEEMSTAQGIISSGPKVHVHESTSSFYSDDEY